MGSDTIKPQAIPKSFDARDEDMSLEDFRKKLILHAKEAVRLILMDIAPMKLRSEYEKEIAELQTFIDQFKLIEEASLEPRSDPSVMAPLSDGSFGL